VGGGAGVIRRTWRKLANQTGSWGLAAISFKSPVFCVWLGGVEQRMFQFRLASPRLALPCLALPCLYWTVCTGPVTAGLEILPMNLSEEVSGCAGKELGL
jgi:hypothetical protein